MAKGQFITFEGLDGCGKSTQIRFLSEYLSKKGIEHIITREPGGCIISEKIRELLLDVKNTGMNPYTEALLYAAARTQLIDEIILPTLEKGVVVLCDRFYDSSIAYQGYGRMLGKDIVANMNVYAMKHCRPDVTFFFDFNPYESADRRKKRQEQDRLKHEDMLFFERVYHGFKAIAASDPARIIRLDVSGTKFETKAHIEAIADRIFSL